MIANREKGRIKQSAKGKEKEIERQIEVCVCEGGLCHKSLIRNEKIKNRHPNMPKTMPACIYVCNKSTFNISMCVCIWRV